MGGKGGGGGEWQLQFPGGGGSGQKQQSQQRQQQPATGERSEAPQQYKPSAPDPGGGKKTAPTIAPAMLIEKPTIGDRLKNAGKYGMMGIATPGTLIGGLGYGFATAKGKKTPLGNAAAPGSLLSDNDEDETSSGDRTSQLGGMGGV